MGNDDLTYFYDNYDVGIQETVSERFTTVLNLVTKRVIIIKNIPCRGSGIIEASINLNGEIIALDARVLHSVSVEIPCLNCVVNPVNLAYEIIVPENLKENSLCVCLEHARYYQNGRDLEGVEFTADVILLD